jgi:hypothetical protein
LAISQTHSDVGGFGFGNFSNQAPARVNAAVQYDPRALAAMVRRNQNHAVSVERTAALMNDFFGLPVSQATVLKAAMASAGILQPMVPVRENTGLSKRIILRVVPADELEVVGIAEFTCHRAVPH